jgi:hypothetical protein
MENPNLNQSDDNLQEKTHQERKSDQREQERALRIDDLTIDSYCDLLPPKKPKIIEIIKETPP